MIELDGSFGEGGGQILRSSLALALLTGRAFHLRHVRARRSKPGLQPQHLMSVQAAAAIGQAKLRGASLQSSDLVFEPGEVRAGEYSFPIRTAGATGMVLHTVYLPLALQKAASQVRIEGGTHVPASPCFHFLDITWRRYLEALGLPVTVSMARPGFYPRGGGLLTAEIAASEGIRGFAGLDAAPVARATVVSMVAGLPKPIAHRQAERARRRLAGLDLKIDVDIQTWDGGPGTMCGVRLETSPVPTFFFSLGARGKPAEQVADEAVSEAQAFLRRDPGVDEHSADQLILPLAFAREPSRFRVARISQHLLTNAAVVQEFLPCRIECLGELGKPGEVAVAPAR